MQPHAFTLIEEINTRQDEALREIDELNERIEHLIELCVATAKAESNQLDQETLTTSEIAADAVDTISLHADSDQADDKPQNGERSRSQAA